MPPWILAALAAGAAAVPVVVAAILLLGPFLLPLWLKTLKKLDRERLLAATGGAYKIIAASARETHSSLVADIAKIVKMVEDETAKSLKGERLRLVENAARSMHADPSKPNLSK